MEPPRQEENKSSKNDPEKGNGGRHQIERAQLGTFREIGAGPGCLEHICSWHMPQMGRLAMMMMMMNTALTNASPVELQRQEMLKINEAYGDRVVKVFTDGSRFTDGRSGYEVLIQYPQPGTYNTEMAGLCGLASSSHDAKKEAICRGLKEVQRRLAKRKVFPTVVVFTDSHITIDAIGRSSLETKTVSAILNTVGNIQA